MTAQPDPVQQQLIAARRAQILDAATQVFAQKGFHRATIKAIAQTAGVADGTIYNYFQNKTDLLFGILDRLNESDARADDFAAALQEVDFKKFLTAYLGHRIELLWPNADVFRAVLPEILVDPALREHYYTQIVTPTMQIAEQFVQHSMDQGELRDLDVALTVRTLAGALFGLFVLHLLGDEALGQRRDELPQVLATVLYEGLHPTPAQGDA